MRQCVVYARVSSKEQEQEGYSIPAQLELLRRYAKQNHFTILQEFTEAETAKKAGRDQFSAMMDCLQKVKQPVALLVEKTDRLYRNLEDYVLVDNLIKQTSLEVHKVKENMVITAESQSFEKFIDGLNALLSKRYIDNLSEEVRKGLRQKVQQGGWPTIAPYGYRNDKNTRQIYVDAERAPFVIRAFQIYATGAYSLDATATQLRKEGFIYKPSAHKISRAQLHDMVRNPAYLGKVPYHGELFDGIHEPLVSAETWHNAQLALRKDSKPLSMSRKEFLFRGAAKCGECNSAMVGELKKGKYIYYRCVAKKLNGCSQGYVSENIISQALADVFGSLKFPADAKERIRAALFLHQKEIEAIANAERSKLDEVEKRIRAKRKEAYNDKLAGRLDSDFWQEIDQGCVEEIRALEIRRAKITDADTDYYETTDLWVELPEQLGAEWIQAEMAEKQKILNFVVSNLVIKDGKALIELHPVFFTLKETNERIKDCPWSDVVRTLILPLFSLHSETIRNISKTLAA